MGTQSIPCHRPTQGSPARATADQRRWCGTSCRVLPIYLPPHDPHWGIPCGMGLAYRSRPPPIRLSPVRGDVTGQLSFGLGYGLPRPDRLRVVADVALDGADPSVEAVVVVE